MEKNAKRSHIRSYLILMFTLLLLQTPLPLLAQSSENRLTIKAESVEQNEAETEALSVLKEQSGEAEAGESAEAEEAATAEVTLPEEPTTSLGIAEEHLPPPGSCRVWYPDRPVEEQPEVRSKCERIQKRMPEGAILLYRPLVNTQFIEVCHFDESNRGIVKMVRFYLAATGELQREEKF